MSIGEELREAIAAYATATTPRDRLAAYLWMTTAVRRARAARDGWCVPFFRCRTGRN